MLQVGEVSSSTKAKFTTEKDIDITLQFNPSEYEFTETPQYSPEYTSWSGEKHLAQYQGNKQRSLNLTLYFDTSAIQSVQGEDRESSSVKTKTDEIENLAKEDGTLHRPPEVTFLWGEMKFTGYVTSVKTTFTLFTSEGIPIRAKVVISLQEKNVDKTVRESPDRTKTRVLSEDVTIWSLAKNEYGDINEWRRIAKANNILNPFDIETGQVLEVPAIVDEE